MTIGLEKTNMIAQDGKFSPNITIEGYSLDAICFLDGSHLHLPQIDISNSLSLDAEVSSRFIKAASIMA